MNDSNQNPRNDLAATLIRRGLPADYAERAAAEFADHHRDLVEELRRKGMSESAAMAEATDRLGDSPSLVKKTVREYQRRYWCARWPLLTFLIAPIPALIATWFAIGFVMSLIVFVLSYCGLSWAEEASIDISATPVQIKLAVLTSFFFVAPVIVMYGFARLARRAALGWAWVALTACIVGLFAGDFRWERIGPGSMITMRDRQTDEIIQQPAHIDFVIMMVPPVCSPAWSEYKRDVLAHPVQLCQCLAPLAVAGALVLQARQQSSRRFQLTLGGC